MSAGLEGELRWSRSGLGEEGGGGWRGGRGSSAGSLRCAASGGRGDSLLGPRAPGDRIRTCPDSQLQLEAAG